jgi:tetratricopeptide (TPR) repeat protein
MKQYTQQQIKFLKENFQQGQKAMQMGMFARAEKHFSDILKIDANIVEAQNALAFVYAASKQHDKAAVQFKIVLKTHPKDAHTHHNLANCLYEQALYSEAISHYKTALEINARLVDSYIHCGMAYRMLKNYDDAFKQFHLVLNLDKRNAKAFHTLGLTFADVADYPRALECLENAVGLLPNNLDYRLDFAKTLELAGLSFEAALQYHKACEENPSSLHAFLLYGGLLSKKLRYDEALECFSRAHELAPQRLDILEELGQTYLGLGNIEVAIDYFNRVLSIEPNRISSLSGIEQAYQDTGKLKQAIELCDQIISITPDQPTGYLLKSSITKSKADDGLSIHLKRFANQEDLIQTDKVAVNFALGKIYDDQADFRQAFQHYETANLLRNNKLNFSQSETEAVFTKLINTINADFIKQYQHIGVDSDLPILIVGMPRSATTLTEQIISSHPQVLGAGEVSYWSEVANSMPYRLSTSTHYPECLNELKPSDAKTIAATYEDTLKKIVGSNANPIHITDKMPHNFLIIGLIALIFPNIKIIHTKRDPIDTCLSIYFQNFNDKHAYSFDLSNLAFYYKQYERLMQHWHTVLPGRIMDINYSDTIADPEYWTRELISHLGLEWDDACLAPHKLERSVRTLSHWQVRQPIYKSSVQRWKNYEEFIQPLIEAFK